MRQVRWPAGKREGFGRREKKQHCEAEEAKESIWKLT